MKKFLLPLFVLMVIAQLAVPAKIIFDSEKVIKQGTAFKFEIQPIDPTDLFRGKYVIIKFKERNFSPSSHTFFPDQTVYVSYKEDSRGFAQIEQVLPSPPDNRSDYLTLTVEDFYEESRKVILNYPLDRFYLEESKAKKAEDDFRKSGKGYVVMNLKDGEGVLHDLQIEELK